MSKNILLNNLSIISAMTRHYVIGQDNNLPWKIPAELAYFKALTMGKALIMGRNTFASLNMRPLPGRHTIVLSKDLEFTAPNLQIARNIAQSLELAAAYNGSEIMVIGGSQIYQQFLPLVSRLYLSFIKEEYSGDSYFPVVNWEQWTESSQIDYPDFVAKIFQRKHAL